MELDRVDPRYLFHDITGDNIFQLLFALSCKGFLSKPHLDCAFFWDGRCRWRFVCKHRRRYDRLFFLLLFIRVPSTIVAHKVVVKVSSDFPNVKCALLVAVSSIHLPLYLSLDLLIPRIIFLIDKFVGNIVIIKLAAFIIIAMILSLPKDLLRSRQCEATRFTMMKLRKVGLSKVKAFLRLFLS